MSAHRPITYRVFTVLLAFLLIGSLVAPLAASQPAAAASDSDCMYESVDWWVFSEVGCAESVESVDTGQSDKQLKIDLHTKGTGLYESWRSWSTTNGNYLEDTETIASLEAKHAIASTYENGGTASEAESNATTAIQDYYSARQASLLGEFERQSAELAYVANVTDNESSINNDWLYNSRARPKGGQDPGPNTGVADIRNVHLTGQTQQVEVTLANGSTMNVTGVVIEYETRPNSSYNWVSKSEVVSLHLARNGRWFELPGSNGGAAEITAQIHVSHAYTDSDGDVSSNYPDTIVLELTEWANRYDEMASQSETVISNYNDGFSEDLFAQLESGEITTGELRTAEGQSRFLAGADDGSNVTQQRLQLATASMLDLNRSADLSNKMVIEYDAATSRTVVSFNSTTSRAESYNYTYTTGTAEGLLFSREVPDSGFVAGTTYNASNLTGTPTIVTDDGDQIPLYKGNFNITSMYSEGEQVQSVEWEQPQYETYNATDFVQYMEQAKEDRAEIESRYSEDDSGGFQIPGIPGLPNAGGAFIGLVIIGGAVVVVVGVVTDLGPGR